MVLSLSAQLPQFSSKGFDGWIYSNPAIELNQSNIVNNKIYLYRTSTGLDLTLTSPLFACNAGQTLDMTVTWITDQWRSDHFVVSKVALTVAILNEGGEAVDSVTYTPVSVSRTNYVNLSLAVPEGLTEAAKQCAAKAHYLAAKLTELPGVELVYDGPFFHEFLTITATALCVRLSLPLFCVAMSTLTARSQWLMSMP